MTKNYTFKHDCLNPEKAKPSRLVEKIMAEVAAKSAALKKLLHTYDIKPGDIIPIHSTYACNDVVQTPSGNWACTRAQGHNGCHAGSPGNNGPYSARYCWHTQDDVISEMDV